VIGLTVSERRARASRWLLAAIIAITPIVVAVMLFAA